MCGFVFGVFAAPPTQDQIRASSKFIQTRGPSSSHSNLRARSDGRWVYSAHYLLDISGLAASQPVYWPDEQAPELMLLFNGEIYNYKELAPDAATDTAAILPLFKRDGDSLWGKLDGEYAIVIYDLSAEKLTIVSDAFMTKPLCVAADPQTGDIGVASYPSGLAALGFKSPRFFEPNRVQTISLRHADTSIFPDESEPCHAIYSYSLEQYSDSFAAWEEAFLAAVRKRASHGALPIFVPLSSGYDSGAICLALNILAIPYYTITIDSQEDAGIIADRIRTNKAAVCRQAITVGPLSRRHRRAIQRAIAQDCEPFQYVHSEQTLLTDEGSLGAYRVAQIARSKGLSVCLSGCGADEIISDYGHAGHKFYSHSEFGGHFPLELEGFFPWKKFYGDTMRSYLFKDELIFGVFGIEGRYPFLDPAVAQAFLSVNSALKNLEYKSPIAAFLRSRGYPFEAGVKRGFSPSRTGAQELLLQRWRGRAARLKHMLRSHLA